MKFLMMFVAFFAFLCSAFAISCPANLKDVNGVCGVQRTIRGDCPDNTKYDIKVNLCVLK
jgi:hypothetical protein